MKNENKIIATFSMVSTSDGIELQMKFPGENDVIDFYTKIFVPMIETFSFIGASEMSASKITGNIKGEKWE